MNFFKIKLNSFGAAMRIKKDTPPLLAIIDYEGFKYSYYFSLLFFLWKLNRLSFIKPDKWYEFIQSDYAAK